MRPGNKTAGFYGSSRSYGEMVFTAPGAATSVDLTTVDGFPLVASITHTGGSQILTVTLSEPVFKVIHLHPELVGTTGAYATIGAISNEGSTTTPLSFTVYTWQANGTALNDCALRCSIAMAFKLSNQGIK